ncbi:MAG: septum formation initiator family protein [Clostridia bacterium]|nr:septum formation initiator family protein [Clostridia bacterium]
MAVKQKRRKSVLLRLLVICVAGYMIFNLLTLWNTLNENRNTLAQLEETYNQKKAEITELTALLEEGSQADIIEKAARERLGYVYSDEVIYIDISGN